MQLGLDGDTADRTRRLTGGERFEVDEPVFEADLAGGVPFAREIGVDASRVERVGGEEN